MSACEDRLPARPLYLEVDTFADLVTGGEQLERWLRVAHDTVFIPLYEGLPAAPARTQPASEWGPPNGFWVGVMTESLPGLDGATEPYEPEVFEVVLAAAARGSVRRLSLSIKALDARGYPSNELGALEIGFDLAGAEYEGAAHAVFAGASGRLLEDPARQAGTWLTLGKLAAATVGCATGYITFDYASPHESPYERSIDRYWLDARRECDRLLRGYFWANFLSAKHIAALGGQAGLAAAPASVEHLDDAAHVVLLELPAGPADVSTEDLRALRDYLRPVLPPQDPTYAYEGPLPLRVVGP